MKSKKSRKIKKGGFFFNNKNNYVAPSGECDPNNLTSIKGSSALHQNYQKCCPKGMFGTKNSSPYCKQIDLNFQAALKGENDTNEYHGIEPEQVYRLKQQELKSIQKKPWYKFGGRKSRKSRKMKMTRKLRKIRK